MKTGRGSAIRAPPPRSLMPFRSTGGRAAASFVVLPGFQLFKLGKVDASTYENLGTHLLSAVIFLGFYHLGPVLLTRLPKMVDTLADLVYPFYLIHTAIGLVAMALVREHIHQPYLILLSACRTGFTACLLGAPSVRRKACHQLRAEIHEV